MIARLKADGATILSGAIGACFDKRAGQEFGKAVAALRRVGEPEPEEDPEPAQEGDGG